jgi:ribosomal protein S18 acetylase RimI-like enzyme
MVIKIRAFAVGDMANVIGSLNEKNLESYEFISMTEERINAWIREGRLKILVAELHGQFVGSAAYNDGHWGEEIRWLVVTDIRDRKALENTLVKEVEKYVKNEKIFASVDAESPEINYWIERGYRSEGGLYHMVADLDGGRPVPKVPAGIILRSLVQGEEEEFVSVVNAGFGWERLSRDDIQKWKIDTPDFNEDWIHVAAFNDRFVSVVVAKRDFDYNRFFRGNRGYLGPAATLPEYRGKNLASALARRAMNFLFNKGMNSVALYTSE